jgi:tetratricopeptide (TPR) repeat protein
MIKHRKKIILFTIIATVLGAAGIHLIQLKFLTKKSVFNKQIIENVKPGPSPSTEEKQEFISSKLKQIPENKVLGNGKHVYQTFNNCGPAALEMALAYFNKSDSQQLIGRQLRPYQNPQGINDDKSVTLTEMAVWVEENKSLKAYHRPAGNIEMVKQFINYDIPVIIRTWLDKNEDIGHYRVVKGFNDLKNTVIQDDSLQGKDLSYKYNDFNQLWEKFNYEFLVLVPKEKQPVAEIILGDILKEEAAWRHSLQISEEILQDSPDNVDALFNRVVALYHLQRYQEAVMAFEKIESDLSK